MANTNPKERVPRPISLTSDHEYFTISEVAQLYRVSELVVRRMIKGTPPKLKAVKFGNQWRIPRSELQDMERNKDWI